MRTFEPARLTDARCLAGLSKTQLAGRIGVSAGLISQFENPARAKAPTDALAATLASALEVKPEFFSRNDTGSLPLVFWRKQTKTPAALKRKFAHFAKMLHELLSEVGVRPAHTMPDYGGLEPASAAVALRRDLCLQLDEPLPSAVDVLERFGVWTHELPLEDSETVDACSTAIDGTFIAFLNPSFKDPYRARITSLHELFHLCAHDAPAVEKEERQKQERDATAFASEVLLPMEVWREICPRRGLSNPWSFMRYKGRFGISIKALMYKTHQAGISSDSEYRYGMMRLSKLGWNKDEARPKSDETEVHEEQPTSAERLLTRVGGIGAVSDILGCTDETSRTLMGQSPHLRIVK